MRKLSVFNLVTLDGFIADTGGDISWHNAFKDVQEREYPADVCIRGAIKLL